MVVQGLELRYSMPPTLINAGDTLSKTVKQRSETIYGGNHCAGSYPDAGNSRIVKLDAACHATPLTLGGED